MTVALGGNRCAHCGLPVSNRAEAARELFCCAGCQAVWHMLHSCGLERYYKLQEESGSYANRPRTKSSFLYLDHDQFQQRHVQRLDHDRLRAELRLDGLKCGACLWLLESLPRLQAGLVNARVDIGRSVIALDWMSEQTSLSEIARRINSLGYEVRPVGTLASRGEWRRQDRAWLVQIAVAGAISGNVMAIAFGLYGAHMSWMDDPTRQFLQWTSVILTSVSVFWPGKLFLINAFNSIRARKPHMDLPIALALLAGLLGGIATTASNYSGVYFESISMLVFLLLVGRFVQFRQQRSARHDLELICALVPQTARRVVNPVVKDNGPAGQAIRTGDRFIATAEESLEEVPAEALHPSDVVEIPAGEIVSADGTIMDLGAHFDMQLLTGESRPIMVGCGESVFAGVRLLEKYPVRIRVEKSGADTRARAIAKMVENATGNRPRVVEFANRIAGWFLLAVVAATTITGLWWWYLDPERILSIVISMLVVTCPCALGLATPLTMVASLGKAAQVGILVRGGDVLERLARSGAIVLDKTGTVTEGRMRVMSQWGDPVAFKLAAALEAHSTHPAALAIVEQFNPVGVVSEVRETLGGGISGRVDGQRVEIGTETFTGVDADPQESIVPAQARMMILQGYTPIFIKVESRVRGVIGMGDPIRSDAVGLVKNLTDRGWKLWMASGDVGTIVRNIGSRMNIPPEQVRGECTPEDKVEIVSECRVELHGGPVVMVGDGVNDLPSMAAADVGIAVRQGARATLEHADVALTGGGLGQIVSLIDGAHRTMRTIHVNFAISLAYNIAGAMLAATGLINPLIAAVLMPVSGITVTAVALRMPKFKKPDSLVGE